jgi:hypothetical protein
MGPSVVQAKAPTKQQANYRKTANTRSCGNCEYMNPNGTCDRLKDHPRVDRNHVCNLWRKAG